MSFAIWSAVVAAFGYGFAGPPATDEHSDYIIGAAVLLTLAIPGCGWPALVHSLPLWRNRLVQVLWLLLAAAALAAVLLFWLLGEEASAPWAGLAFLVYAAIAFVISISGLLVSVRGSPSTG